MNSNTTGFSFFTVEEPAVGASGVQSSGNLWDSVHVWVAGKQWRKLPLRALSHPDSTSCPSFSHYCYSPSHSTSLLMTGVSYASTRKRSSCAYFCGVVSLWLIMAPRRHKHINHSTLTLRVECFVCCGFMFCVLMVVCFVCIQLHVLYAVVLCFVCLWLYVLYAYGCMFCMLLFNFCKLVFLLLCLCILIFMYFHCYISSLSNQPGVSQEILKHFSVSHNIFVS